MVKIDSRKNTNYLYVKQLGKSRSFRKENGEFLCDGKKLLIEAINSRAVISNVFITEPQIIEDISLPDKTKIFLLNKELLLNLSPLKNPQELLFTCKIPATETIDLSKGTHILLDSVQDPGNIGTIIRTADAFGIDSIILTGECADSYNPKTIRASMGAIFRQKLSYKSLSELQNMNVRFIGTGRNIDYIAVNNSDLDYGNSIIVLGNEGQGISDNITKLCKEFICIPISPQCESLNVAVAAAIIMWEVARIGQEDGLC